MGAIIPKLLVHGSCQLQGSPGKTSKQQPQFQDAKKAHLSPYLQSLSYY
jgi:hypothetical protein